MPDIIITEGQYSRLISLLTEDREGKNMAKARRVVSSMLPGMDAMKVITAIRNDIPNSRINDCKYLPGVARMYADRQLTDARDIFELNNTLKVIGTAHDSEFDGNLNGESARSVISRFRDEIRANTEARKSASASRQYSGRSDYKVVRIPSFNDAAKYSNYTSWCITHAEKNYDQYTHEGIGIFYFLLKEGFEDVPERKGPNCPLDDYGMSMVAVSINEDGSLNTSTCRWNHDWKGNDQMFTDEQISELLGRNMYDVLKPREIEVLADNEMFKIFKGDGKVQGINKKTGEKLNFTSDGTAPFNESFGGHGCGRVDMHGNIVVQPKYFSVWPFESDGCAKVMKYSYGLVTRDGQQMFEVGPKGTINMISSATKNGTRLYRNDNGDRGLINVRLGKHIKPGDYNVISEADDDGRFVIVSKEGTMGLLNDDLTWAIPLGIYDSIEFVDTHDWCRVVSVEDGDNDICGLVNENCELVLPLQFPFIMEECTIADGEKEYSRPLATVVDGKRMRGRAYKQADGSMLVKWRNGQEQVFRPQRKNTTVNEEKIVAGKSYMHRSQAPRIIPEDIYKRSLGILMKQYPDFKFNCVMYSPREHVVRFDLSEDFNTTTEPSISQMISVNYETGETKVGRSTSAVWHERSFWVDNDYDEFDRDKDREWVQTYRNAIKKKPHYGRNPQGGSRAAWMNHLMNLGIIDKYFEVNGIENPEEYLDNVSTSKKFPKGFLVNKYRRKFQK